MKIQLYLIVNIECVKINEINDHLLFDKILCNNYNSYFIMNNLLNNKVNYLGFHLENEFINHNKKLTHNNYFETNKHKTLKFICCGGLNSISRKNIDVIFDSFIEILNEYNDYDIELNIYIQSVECPSNLNIDHPKINKHFKYFSYQENLENIAKNDIFIHCGGQEGLGLGFYEALYLGLPILTLDWTPNNEIINNNINGWLVPVKIDRVYENMECLINRALINKSKFKEKILEIANNLDKTYTIIHNTILNKNKLIKKNKLKFEKNLKTIFNE